MTASATEAVPAKEMTRAFGMAADDVIAAGNVLPLALALELALALALAVSAGASTNKVETRTSVS